MADDPRFGVALTKCYFCGKDSDIIINSLLAERVAKKVKEMHGKVVSMDPCRECEGFMKQGIIFLTFDPAKSARDWNKDEMPNPWRTGGFFVVRQEAVERMLGPGSMLDFALKYRYMWIEHEAAERLGFFRTVSGPGGSSGEVGDG